MKFKLPSQGVPRPSDGSDAIIAAKHVNGAIKSHEIAEYLYREGTASEIWDKNEDNDPIIALCESKAREYNQPSYVTSTSIWLILRNLLRNNPI